MLQNASIVANKWVKVEDSASDVGSAI